MSPPLQIYRSRELVNNYYLSDGTKVKSDMTRSHKGYYYVGPFRYKRDEDGAYSLDKVRFGGGEIIADSTGKLGVAFIITDHLESVRLKVNEDGEIIGSYDYLPYGMLASTSSGLGKDNATLLQKNILPSALTPTALETLSTSLTRMERTGSKTSIQVSYIIMRILPKNLSVRITCLELMDGFTLARMGCLTRVIRI